MTPYRGWIAAGALTGAVAVGLAAYAAHGPIEPARLRGVASAVQIQGWHALALIGCGLYGSAGGWPVHLAAVLFLLGMILFCAAIWVPVFGGPALGLVAPTGGITLMVAWLVLAFAAIRSPTL